MFIKFTHLNKHLLLVFLSLFFTCELFAQGDETGSGCVFQSCATDFRDSLFPVLAYENNNAIVYGSYTLNYKDVEFPLNCGDSGYTFCSNNASELWLGGA